MANEMMMNVRTDEYEIKDNVFMRYNPAKEKDFFEIPDGVSEIAASAFEGCDKLVEIYIPDSVQKIGKAAFKNCTRLEELALPDGIKKIEDELFKNCSYLGMPAIPFGVKEIGREAFSGCLFEETKAKIPATVEKIGEGAFANNGYLKAITLPNRVYIEKNAFDEKTDIKNRFNYNDGKIKVKDGVLTDFMETKDITELEIPEGVIRINSEVFYNCEYLEKVSLPEGLQEIGYEAFFGCTGLQEINFPESLKKIEFRAFSGCESLESVELGKGITKVDKGAFKDCDSLENLVISDKGAAIADDAFEGCYALEEMSESEEMKSAAQPAEEMKLERETPAAPDLSDKVDAAVHSDTNKSEKSLAEDAILKDNISVPTETAAAAEKVQEPVRRLSFGDFRGRKDAAPVRTRPVDNKSSKGRLPLANIFSR